MPRAVADHLSLGNTVPRSAIPKNNCKFRNLSRLRISHINQTGSAHGIRPKRYPSMQAHSDSTANIRSAVQQVVGLMRRNEANDAEWMRATLVMKVAFSGHDRRWDAVVLQILDEFQKDGAQIDWDNCAWLGSFQYLLEVGKEIQEIKDDKDSRLQEARKQLRTEVGMNPEDSTLVASFLAYLPCRWVDSSRICQFFCAGMMTQRPMFRLRLD